MEKSKEERISEIDLRIEGLTVRSDMWIKAGGRGGMMAMKADAEIKELKLERDDLINGTHKLPIYRIEKELERLTYLRRDANIFQKVIYNSKIKKLEKELYALKEQDRNIASPSNSSDEITSDDLDNVVGEVPYEVSKEMVLNQNFVDDNTISYGVEDLNDVDGSFDIEEKGKSR